MIWLPLPATAAQWCSAENFGWLAGQLQHVAVVLILIYANGDSLASPPCMIPIQWHDHPLDNNISTIHLSHIQEIIKACNQNPDAPIPNLFDKKINL